MEGAVVSIASGVRQACCVVTYNFTSEKNKKVRENFKYGHYLNSVTDFALRSI